MADKYNLLYVINVLIESGVGCNVCCYRKNGDMQNRYILS